MTVLNVPTFTSRTCRARHLVASVHSIEKRYGSGSYYVGTYASCGWYGFETKDGIYSDKPFCKNCMKVLMKTIRDMPPDILRLGMEQVVAQKGRTE